MKASSGNPPAPPAGQETATGVSTEPGLPAEPLAKRDYRKPRLKRLGLLRSVTGSDFEFH